MINDICPMNVSQDGVVAARPGIVGVFAGTDALAVAHALMNNDLDASASIRTVAREVLRRDLTAGAIVSSSSEVDEVFAFGAFDVIVGDERHQADAEIVGLTLELASGTLTGIVPSGTEAAAPGWQRLSNGVMAGDGFIVAAVGAEAAPAPAAAASPEPAPVAPEPPVAAAATDPSPQAATPEAAPVEPSGSPTVEPDPTAEGNYRSVDLTASVDSVGSAPLPVHGERDADEEAAELAASGPAYRRPVEVLGVQSPRGHFNHPDARYCSRTGVKIGASQTRAFVKGIRPALGIISFDDGLTYSVQWNTVIGRDPNTDPRVIAEEAAPFAVGADQLAVSRSHLLLELEDWNVLISDLDTANGTFLRAASESTARRLAPGERVVIGHGAEVHLGERSFVFHEHHTR